MSVVYLRPSDQARARHPAGKQIDDFFREVDDSRVKQDLDPRLRRTIGETVDALKRYIDGLLELDEAAATYWRGESGPVGPSGTTPSSGGVKRTRDQRIDRFLRREAVRELQRLQAHIGRCNDEVRLVRDGGQRRRAKLNEDQVALIRSRPNENRQALADEFNVSHGTIRNVLEGKTWKQSE